MTCVLTKAISACLALLLIGCANTGGGDHKAVEAAWAQAKRSLVGMSQDRLDRCMSPIVSETRKGDMLVREYFAGLVFYGGMSSISCTLTLTARQGVVEAYSTSVTSSGGAHKVEEVCAYPVERCLGLPKPFDISAAVIYSPDHRAKANTVPGVLRDTVLGLSAATAAATGQSGLYGSLSSTPTSPDVRTYSTESAHVAGRPPQVVTPYQANPDGAAAGNLAPLRDLVQREEAKARTRPAMVGRCPGSLKFIEPELPNCPNSELVSLTRRFALASDVVFADARAQGQSWQSIRDSFMQAVAAQEAAIEQNLVASTEMAATDTRRSEFRAATTPPYTCTAGGSSGMSSVALQAAINAHIMKVAAEAAARVAVCRGAAERSGASN